MQIQNEYGSETSTHNRTNPQSDLVEAQRDFKVPIERLFAAFKTSDAITAAEAKVPGIWPETVYITSEYINELSKFS